MEKQEVRIGGEAFAVISREAAEKIIREADPRTLTAKALEQADEWHDGFAALDLQTGMFLSMHKERGESYRPGGTLIPLYEVSVEDVFEFGSPAMVPNIIGEEEAEEIVENHRGEPGYPFDKDDIEAEDVDNYLGVDGESYESRWVAAYLHEHGDDPDPKEILRQVREELNEVYGAVE